MQEGVVDGVREGVREGGREGVQVGVWKGGAEEETPTFQKRVAFFDNKGLSIHAIRFSTKISADIR